MREVDPNRMMTLATLILMLLIAAEWGYRISISRDGLIFEATDIASGATSSGILK